MIKKTGADAFKEVFGMSDAEIDKVGTENPETLEALGKREAQQPEKPEQPAEAEHTEEAQQPEQVEEGKKAEEVVEQQQEQLHDDNEDAIVPSQDGKYHISVDGEDYVLPDGMVVKHSDGSLDKDAVFKKLTKSWIHASRKIDSQRDQLRSLEEARNEAFNKIVENKTKAEKVEYTDDQLRDMARNDPKAFAEAVNQMNAAKQSEQQSKIEEARKKDMELFQAQSDQWFKQHPEIDDSIKYELGRLFSGYPQDKQQRMVDNPDIMWDALYDRYKAIMLKDKVAYTPPKPTTPTTPSRSAARKKTKSKDVLSQYDESTQQIFNEVFSKFDKKDKE
jgi:hypothetical protein